MKAYLLQFKNVNTSRGECPRSLVFANDLQELYILTKSQQFYDILWSEEVHHYDIED